jgi:maltose O-acetyltransferase
MIAYLWRNRESPTLFSRRWLIVWVKRLLNAPNLLASMLRHARLRLRGASLAELVVIESCRVQGVMRNLSIGEGSFIGEDTQMMLHERITIGERVVINRGVTILTASHDVRDPRWRMLRQPVAIGDYAWIATGAMLLPGVKIGRGAVVGAGAVVRRDVPERAIVAGNPAVALAMQRCVELDYLPAAFAAPIEAWLGPAGMSPDAAERAVPFAQG